MNVRGGVNLTGKSSDRTERVPGRLLRRVSTVYDKSRADYASVTTSNYGRPEGWNAETPDGLWLNYTPVSDDSIIRVRAGVYCYRGNSSADGAGTENYYSLFHHTFQFGDEITGRVYQRDYLGDAYRWFKIEVPSWGKGQTRPVRWRVVNNGASYRVNLLYPSGENDAYYKDYLGGKVRSFMPTFCIEEYSATEPLETPVILWDENDVDY